MNFFETRMGQNFFEWQIPQLINALQELSAALPKTKPAVSLPIEPDPNLLSKLYYGDYESGVFVSTEKSRRLNHDIIQAQQLLEKSLPLENMQQFKAYVEAATVRNSDALQQSYCSGVQTAVQMILAGLSQPSAAEKEDTHGKSRNIYESDLIT